MTEDNLELLAKRMFEFFRDQYWDDIDAHSRNAYIGFAKEIVEDIQNEKHYETNKQLFAPPDQDAKDYQFP